MTQPLTEAEETRLREGVALDGLANVMIRRGDLRSLFSTLDAERASLAETRAVNDALREAVDAIPQECDGSGAAEVEVPGEEGPVGMELVQCRGCIACDPRFEKLRRALALSAPTGVLDVLRAAVAYVEAQAAFKQACDAIGRGEQTWDGAVHKLNDAAGVHTYNALLAAVSSLSADIRGMVR